MKKLFTLALALVFSSLASATTLTPLSLLSPLGSTSGQVIASTGSSSVPVWTTVTLSGLGGLAAANNLSDVASVSTARTNLGAAATASPLSQFAPTTSAQLAGVISDETGTGSAVFGASPTITTPNIVGTTAGGNANTGSDGEYLTATTSGTSVVTGTGLNCTSESLTAGDWDVQSVVLYTPAGTTTMIDANAGVSTTSATLPALGAYSKYTWLNTGQVLNNNTVVSSPVVRVSIASTATVYAVGFSDFGTSTLTCNGFIRARRVR